MSDIRSRRWFPLVWAVPVALVVLVGAVLAARGIRESDGGAAFLAQYPGETELPAGAPVGLPWWLLWQHFLNALLLLLIIRSGWLIRTTTRPPAYWSPRKKRGPGAPTRIGLHVWFHLALDVVWVANGILFFVLLAVTGQWMRIVPTSWDIVPNALSAGLQYLSLDWPTESGWTNYNSLQVVAYFVTVYIAAPVALLTGIRMSPFWPKDGPLVHAYPVTIARRLHFPTMIYFVAFIVVHVTLVLATGALRNLNHMYAGRDDGSWWGLGIFAISLAVMVAAWILARPVLLRSLAGLTGTVSR